VIYSVYNYDRREYDYFDAPGPKGTHAEAPPKPLLAPTSMGVAPEAATWKLPIGAKRIGSGPMPKGRVASSGGGALGGVVPEGATVPIAIGLVILAMRFFK
jgi:hypothetical protein